MAPKYKLTYWPVTGLGEPIRYLLAYNNIDFEDYRFAWDEWPSVKPSTPFGKVPVLEVDGKQYHQSVALCRYLAKQAKLNGKNDLEDLEIDQIIDTISDFRVPLLSYFYDPDPVSKESKRDGVENDSAPYYLSRLEKIASANGGRFVGSQLTWADLYFASIYSYLERMIGKPVLDQYPTLKALINKVEDIPQIKAWIAKRAAEVWPKF